MHVGEEPAGRIDRQQGEIVHREPWERRQRVITEFDTARAKALDRGQRTIRVFLGAEPPEQGVGLQSRAAACGAWRVRAVLRQEHSDVHLVRLALQPGEKALHAIPRSGPRTIPADPLIFAFEDPTTMPRIEIAPWNIEWHGTLFRVLHEIILALAKTWRLPRPHRAAAQCLAVIGHHEPMVDPDHAPKAATRLACAERRVEREQAGAGILVMDVAIGAMQVRG